MSNDYEYEGSYKPEISSIEKLDGIQKKAGREEDRAPIALGQTVVLKRVYQKPSKLILPEGVNLINTKSWVMSVGGSVPKEAGIKPGQEVAILWLGGHYPAGRRETDSEIIEFIPVSYQEIKGFFPQK